MHEIIFISTIHREFGECNADELHKIIEQVSPEVIFLEAVDETYSEYENYVFSTYGVFHNKLEIAAMQKYSLKNPFEYVPVCQGNLSEAFHQKSRIVSENKDLQKLIEKSIFNAASYGFSFLNSLDSIKLHEEMRELESEILKGNEIDQIVKDDIDLYETTMIENIYSFSKEHKFEKAIFMCGAAHRKAIIEKIEKFKLKEEITLNWTVFGT